MSILLAMGDDVDARLLMHLLAPLQRQLVLAVTTAEAERYIGMHSFAVVVVDTTSLDGDGLDLVRRLAKRDFEGTIIVINPTGDIMAKVEALDGGADDYIVYPYEPAELLARIRAALRRWYRRTRQAAGSRVRVGPVELDVNELEVAVPGKCHIRLTPSEMRLLLYLMTHNQRAVDRQELLAYLFGPDTQRIAPNIIGVYVQRVRRKIENDPNHPCYVVTIRGQGYQFRVPDEEEGYSQHNPTALSPELQGVG